MDINIYSETISNLIPDMSAANKPHVVILGAGASRAAFLDGDKNGKQVPLMNDLIQILGLKEALSQKGIEITENENFETLYSRLYNEDKYSNFLVELEDIINNYFSELELPEKPTLYDQLVLSLRKKDVIATFNWDPFLWLSCERICKQITNNIPKIFFLHGNVEVALDTKNRLKVSKYIRTEENHSDYPMTKLIYPIENKDYTKDNFIISEWKALQKYLRNANALTVFGYGAPQADIEAKKLLMNAWNNNPLRQKQIENIEIVDIKQESEVRETWNDFFSSHERILDDIHKSFILRYPRRSCEAMNRQNFGCEFLDDGAMSGDVWKYEDFHNLKQWFEQLINAENNS